MMFKRLMFLGLISLMVFQMNIGKADEAVKKIWPHIYLTRGADYQEMSNLIAKKKMGYIKEMMAILVQSMEKIYEAGGFATTGEMLEAILTFNQLYTSDLEEAHRYLPASISVDFSSSLMQLFKKHNIPLEKRKFVFTHGQLLDFVSNNGVKNIPTNYLRSEVDYILVGEYIVASQENLRLAINLIELKSGKIVDGFNVDANPMSVPSKLAQAMFDSFQKNKSPAFENPQVGLTWIFEPSSEAFKKPVFRNQAVTYCASQRHRLPYFEELLQLSGGGNYHAGGFELHTESTACYYVADNKDMHVSHRSTGAYTYFPSMPELQAHVNTNKCYFVCVKGTLDPQLDTLNRLYEIHRSDVINGMSVDDNIRALVRYLILKLDPNKLFNTTMMRSPKWESEFPNPEDGVRALKRMGYL